MLDLTGILFSSILMILVVVRAVQLDRARPWFQKIDLAAKPARAMKQPWQKVN